jgi:broad specificity phosphatase PhoE
MNGAEKQRSLCVLLIRHGQSANNVLAESQGHDYATYMAGRNPEPPLSEIGQRQAQLLAEWLGAAAARPRLETDRLIWVMKEHPIDRLFVSPMLRALQTALPISRALKLEPQVWVDIHEHGGVFTGNPHLGNVVSYGGVTRAQITADFAHYQVVDGVHDGGWWAGGYEEMDVCYSRAGKVAARLHELAEQQRYDTIALVTHGTFLDALLHALFVPDESYGERIHFSHLNTAVSRLDFSPNRRIALRYLNRIDHLPPELITR